MFCGLSDFFLQVKKIPVYIYIKCLNSHTHFYYFIIGIWSISKWFVQLLTEKKVLIRIIFTTATRWTDPHAEGWKREVVCTFVCVRLFGCFRVCLRVCVCQLLLFRFFLVKNNLFFLRLLSLFYLIIN